MSRFLFPVLLSLQHYALLPVSSASIGDGDFRLAAIEAAASITHLSDVNTNDVSTIEPTYRHHSIRFRAIGHSIVHYGKLLKTGSPQKQSKSVFIGGNVHCPSPCTCERKSDGTVVGVGCSGRNLTSFPNLPTSILWANLSHNAIVKIPCDMFSQRRNLTSLDVAYNRISQLPVCFANNADRETLKQKNSLQFLDVSQNLISEVHPGTFRGFQYLTHLNMSFNHIHNLCNSSFVGLTSLTFLSLMKNDIQYETMNSASEAFRGLANLEELHLEGNQNTEAPKESLTYPDQALSHLVALRRLYMDGIASRPGPGFSRLPNLQLLSLARDLDGQTSDCTMVTFPSDFFAHFNSSQDFSLDLSACKIEHFPNDSFSSIPNIVSLDLRWNDHLTFRGFEVGSESLVNSTLEYLDITDISENIWNIWTNETLQHLSKTPLKTLKMMRNHIYLLDPSAVLNLPRSLEVLMINDNKIQSANVLAEFLLLDHLKVINVSYQLHYSSYSDDSKPLFHWDWIPLPKSLEFVYFNGNKLGYAIPKTHFYNNKVLRHVEYAGNLATRWIGPIYNLDALEYLDLSNNYCNYMNKYFFSELRSVVTLLLRNNYLGFSLAQDLDGVSFTSLRKLEVLDLSSNAISILSRNVFIENVNLKVLNLSKNAINDFSLTLSNLDNVSTIDISRNSLYGLDSNICDDLKRMKRGNPQFTVNLLNNPLKCSCEYLDFLWLLVDHPTIFLDVERLNCTSDGSLVAYSSMSKVARNLERKCYTPVLFVGALVAISVIIGILAVSGGLYYNRNKLRYLLHLRNKRMHVGDREINVNPIADCVVIYDQEDQDVRQLIIRTFTPRLREHGLSYLLGEVHFQPCHPLQQMSDAILSTRKTLVLLSCDLFLDSMRLQETNLAILHELSTEKDILITVFLERLDLATLPVEIVTYLRGQYDSVFFSDTDEFWQLLSRRILEIGE